MGTETEGRVVGLVSCPGAGVGRVAGRVVGRLAGRETEGRVAGLVSCPGAGVGRVAGKVTGRFTEGRVGVIGRATGRS